MSNSNDIRTQLGPKPAYERVMDTLMDATMRVEQSGIGIDDFLPALLDFAAGVALAMDGEQSLRAAVIRMNRRVEDYRNGTFPVNSSERVGQ
jgi:hypothetical protein